MYKIDNDFIICINSTSSYGRQRFTLAHELYHIIYESIHGQIVCNMEMGVNKSDSEKEADLFAGYLLMPYDALYQQVRKIEKWTLSQVIDIEQLYMVSHESLIFRLETEGFISSELANEFRNIKVSKEATILGYGKELYMPQPEGRQYLTTGEYIRKIEKSATLEAISEGKKNELLLDGFRGDIVYNLDEEEVALND